MSILPLSAMLLALLTCIPTASAGKLYGIGYREQELQVAKGTTFNSESPTGIPYASFAGDINIFIKGDGLEDGAQNNIPALYSHDLSKEFSCPPLTEDDAFGSNPNMGFVSYRLPSIPTLLGLPME